MNLTFEDFNLAKKIVDNIIDNTNIIEIENKLRNIINDYTGNKRRQFLCHLNALFLNILLNELTFKCKEAEEKAIKARLITKTLIENLED